ncbi:carboxylesterase family protein [Gramella sp. GC03-9]|uniref:Carboxylic ester hydrolase n=1 Tax=Christiangramia oceanisediminis TaxID=2920386 RepID=A0A9X2KXA9_9FLAO|nr:carboxylesterase family protein [Gramella oceanisediminis]MCP9198916.1 carboxylesterase family protein [Gramella oceanisediminis]
MRLKFLLFIAVLFVICTGFYQGTVEVQTKYGIVQGEKDAQLNLDIFKGIPFAQPPVGNLRWKAPQTPASWKGVRETKSFAPAAVQTNVFGDMVYRGDGFSEDCLYLNIWTPETQPNKKLPVLVYFYGGGFVAGDGSEPRYDGASLAQQGIVVITVNYRLNIFGFFAHPQLSAESDYAASGNYGLLDQNAALRWVAENISGFGGDPSKITIAGESAGSISVSAQMASPLSRELLSGAIGESGGMIKPTLPPVPLSEAEKIGEEVVEKSGYTFEEFRKLPTDSIFKIYNTSGRFGFPVVIDNHFLPKSLPEIFKEGEQAQIPLLVGWNSAEMSPEAFLQGNDFSLENFRNKVGEAYPEDRERVLDLYPVQTEAKVKEAATNLASDRFISYSTWKWAELHSTNSENPVYRYLFSRIRPADPASEYKPSGAAHASEIEYFLGNLSKEYFPFLKEKDFKISNTIQQYLVNFIKTGNPNSEGLEYWPSLKEKQTNSVMVMDEKFQVIKPDNENRYRFHDQYYGND